VRASYIRQARDHDWTTLDATRDRAIVAVDVQDSVTVRLTI
jgi:hypothetical protein